MRGFVGLAGAAALSVFLAGCYSAETALITDANSVAPYAKITYRDKGLSTSDTAIMTRDGKLYRLSDKDGAQGNVRFMATERPDWFVAQMEGPSGSDGIERLFAVVKLDTAKREAWTYRSYAADPKVATPGHHVCKDAICIDDIKAYVAQAFDFAGKGGKPDVIYDVKLE